MLSWVITAPPAPRVSLLELGPLPTSVPCARLHARNVLTEWRLPRDTVADAEVIVSELIANAVQATMSLPDPQPIALRLHVNAIRLMIESWDRHPDDPVLRPAPPDAEGGRGLAVVEAYSTRWGCLRVTPQMKAVWSELPVPYPARPVLPLAHPIRLSRETRKLCYA